MKTLVPTIALIIVACAMLSPLASCSGNAQKARQWLETGQAAFGKDSIYDAFINLQRAMDEAERAGDKETYFEANVYLAMLYEQVGQRDKSEKMLRNLQYVEATTNPSAFSSQYYFRFCGYYATLHQDYDSMIYCAQQAIKLDKKLYPNDLTYLYGDMGNLAEAYLAAGDTASAWEVVRQVNSMPQPSKRLGLGQIYYLRSLLETQNLDSAYHYANLCYECSKDHISNNILILSLQRLCALDSCMRNMDAYMEHKRILDASKEYRQGTEVAYKISALQEQGKIERIQEKNEKRLWIGVMLIVLLCLALFTVISLLRMSHRNAQTKQRLAESTIQREMLEKELLQLRMRKNEAKLEAAHKKNVSMTELITEIKHNLPNTEDEPSLATLESTMKIQCADFLERVEHRYPELTDNDVRLMGFIRMGVKPKVMAMALNISMKSLNSARYRLRKRLKLSNETNLNEFISGI